MLKSWGFGLALMAAAVTSGASPASADSDEVRSTVLPNGTTLLTSQRPVAQVVAFHAAFRGGSRDEDDDTVGAAHFMEHMFFQGAARYADQAAIFDSVTSRGGWINAFTSFEQIAFQVVVAADDFDIGLDVLSDILVSSTFPADKVDKERAVVLEELNRGRNSPERYADEVFTKAVLRGHPAERLPIGSRETVNNANRDVLVDFRDKYFVSNNMVVAVVGPMSHEDVLARAAPAFANMRQGPFYERPAVSPPPAHPERIALQAGSSQGRVLVGTAVPGLDSPEQYPLDVLAEILGSSGRRLMRDLRDQRGLVADAGSSSYQLTDVGLFELYAAVVPSKTEEALDGLLSHVRQIRDSGPTDEEVANAIRFIEGRTELGMQGSIRQAGSIAGPHTLGQAAALDVYLQGIRKVTAPDVLNVARQYLDPEQMSVVVVKP
jgi:predicted Zn-dependent peptidase